MLLKEVFNANIAPYLISNSESICFMRFTVNGMTYVFRAEDDTIEEDPSATWEVSFALQNDGDDTVEYGATGTGNAFNVFAGAKQCCLKLIQLHPEIGQIVFTGDKSDPSRIKLYDRFLRHIKIPGWTFRKEIGGGRDFYILVKQ